MTVGELIAALQLLDPAADVAIWQEDCNDGWYTPNAVHPREEGRVMVWTTWLGDARP